MPGRMGAPPTRGTGRTQGRRCPALGGAVSEGVHQWQDGRGIGMWVRLDEGRYAREEPALPPDHRWKATGCA